MRSLPSALPFVMTIWHACVPQCWNVSWRVCGAPAWRVYCFGPKAGVMSAKPAGGNITATNANAITSTIILPDIFLSFCLQLRSSLLGPSGRGGTTSGPRHTISAGGSARKTRTGLGFRSAICCAHTVPASSCPEGQACPKGRSSDWERKLAADAAPGSGRFAREASVHRNHAAPRLQFYRPCRVLRTPRHTAGWRLHRHSERSRYSKRASRTRGTEVSRGLAPGEFPVRRYASRYAADARLVFCAGQESSCLRNRQSGCLTLDAGRRLGPRITSCSQPLSKKLTHYFWGPTKNCRSPACG